VVRQALGALRGAEDGTVALLSSHTVGEPWPSLVAYSSSKAALEEMARGLRVEEPTLRVLSIRVGNTATSFADGWDPGRFEVAFSRWINSGLMRHGVMSAHDVAELVLEAVADRDAPDEMLVRGDEEVLS
jgi:NAD(P)-dependent dehydrogenase (short-subunit alcohol dehydrogenase family)